MDKETLSRARVLVVGDAMLDRYFFGDVERISPEAPVPVVRVTREEARLGGAANVALNVKSLGATVTLITVVGNDEPAVRLQGLLQEKGVASILGTDAKLHTCVKLRVIGRAQLLACLAGARCGALLGLRQRRSRPHSAHDRAGTRGRQAGVG
jgi:D-glycero-beta-D-manno-heptose-7-phosphate kinase